MVDNTGQTGRLCGGNLFTLPAMVPLIIEKSPLNPVAFVPDEPLQQAGINTVHPGQDWEVNTLPAGMQRMQYAYKAEIGDPWEFQFNITYQGVTGLSLILYKPVWTVNGPGHQEVFVWTTYTADYLLTNRVVLDGVSLPMGCYHFRISPADVPNLKPGLYMLKLKVEYDNTGGAVANDEKYEKSEPIRIAHKHPRTILIKAYNNTNDYRTVFVQTGAVFHHRVEGRLHSFLPDSVDTQYANQEGVRRKLYSLPGFINTLTIGGGQGVPDWVKSWANYALSCDYIDVDTRRITKDDNSQWEQISIPGYPLGGESIAVRAGDPSDTFKTVHRTYVTLFTRPASGLPYFIHSIGTDNVSFGGAYYIGTYADERRLLVTLKSQIVTAGYTGYAAFVGNQVRYINGPGETEDTSETIILPYAMRVGSVGGPGSTSIGLFLEGYSAGIVKSDGAASAYGDGVTFDNYTPTLVNTSTPGEIETLIFHNNSLTNIALSSISVNSFTGTIPTAFIQFAITGTSLTTFDIGTLLPARTLLQFIDLGSNALTSILRTSFFALPGFSVLSNLSVGINNLPVSAVNQILEDIDDMVHSTGITGGTLNTSAQTPAAVPTGTGAVARTHLVVAHTWTVITD